MCFADLRIEKFCYRDPKSSQRLTVCRPLLLANNDCSRIHPPAHQALNLLPSANLVDTVSSSSLMLLAMAIIRIFSHCLRIICRSIPQDALAIVAPYRKPRPTKPSTMSRTQKIAHELSGIYRLQTTLNSLSRSPGFQRAAHAVSGMSHLQTSLATRDHPPAITSHPPANIDHPPVPISSRANTPPGYLLIRPSGSDPVRLGPRSKRNVLPSNIACHDSSPAIIPLGYLLICLSGSDHAVIGMSHLQTSLAMTDHPQSHLSAIF
jgi:hypothetical protein